MTLELIAAQAKHGVYLVTFVIFEHKNNHLFYNDAPFGARRTSARLWW